MSRRHATPQLSLDLPPSEPTSAAVVGASNAEAIHALAAWPMEPGALALVGPAGCGKSLIAQGWAERVGAFAMRGAEADLADLPELEGRPVLLDEASEASDETLFHLLNLALLPGGALLLVDRAPPSTWQAALPDLRSRLDALRVLTVEAPDDAVLSGMLIRSFEARGLRPPEDLIAYLVRRIERTPAAVIRIAADLDHFAQGRGVTRSLAVAFFAQEHESGDLLD
ncbi:chromosomal replication initiator DnaA [Brevundimonas sp. 2R-24]|uniref:Chromosomal replication initiator DnaA n=1 Tax=Peiella sedimenti TaxID=3061083 RepID=A0ABT8SJX0_9CAUL|nr:chromosomal replication initiator DnaA [Caulobacteraceae bacterium XZ-24]